MARMNLIVVAATVVLLALLAGCAPQLDRIELSVQENRDEVSALAAETRRLRQEVESMGELLRMESNVGEETNAQRTAILSRVVGRLDQLIVKLDDNTEYMRDLSARVDLLATRAGVPQIGKEYVPPPAGNQAAVADLPEEGRSIFQAAQLDRSRGNVALAREGFTEFIERYGQSELADDARYWLGDLAYGENDCASAGDHFARLLQEHPDTPWAPAALLKSGYCLQRLDEQEEAREVFQTLITRFPETNEAALAREALAP